MLTKENAEFLRALIQFDSARIDLLQNFGADHPEYLAEMMKLQLAGEANEDTLLELQIKYVPNDIVNKVKELISPVTECLLFGK